MHMVPACHGGYPKNAGWFFVGENPTKMDDDDDDLGVPLFQETPISEMELSKIYLQ